MGQVKQYSREYKEEAIKLAEEKGCKNASEELGISYHTLYDWIKQARKGNLHLEKRSDSNVSKLEEELQQLRKAAKDQAKEIKRLQEENEFLAEATAFFAASRQKCAKKERMKFIALKTNDGKERGKIAFYCRVLEVTRQGFYDYLKNRDNPWKYEALAAEMIEIVDEDECNDTYGRKRMYYALLQKHTDGEGVPGESTVYRVMNEIGITHRPRRKPDGITKADRDAMKSDDPVKREFKANKPCEKCVTDITEIKGKDGKLYTSVIFDCFDLTALGLSMDTNMKAELCVETVKNAVKSYPELKGAILHSDRGSQYTSEKYREILKHAGFVQSMNSAGGRCHDNARCESMWARIKEELFYSRNRKSEDYTVAELKTMIWRYYMSYWNNRRICSANGGLPPAVKRKRYYESLVSAA